MRRECMAGRKCIAAMTKKKEEMDAELANLREIISSLSEKMDTWRLRHEILASQRDRSEATIQVGYMCGYRHGMRGVRWLAPRVLWSASAGALSAVCYGRAAGCRQGERKRKRKLHSSHEIFCA